MGSAAAASALHAPVNGFRGLSVELSAPVNGFRGLSVELSVERPRTVPAVHCPVTAAAAAARPVQAAWAPYWAGRAPLWAARPLYWAV